MDFASLREQLQAMLQSDATMFTIGTFVITERIAAIAGIISGILTIISIIQIFVSISRWAFGPKESRADMLPVMLPTNPSGKIKNPELDQMAKAKQIAEDPNSITDTSDKKRSLYDYVTPDSIHAEVLKQTLNNDYPYQVLRPGTMLPKLPQSFESLTQQPKEGSLSSVEFQLPGSEMPAVQNTPTIQPTSVAEVVAVPQQPIMPIQSPVVQFEVKQEEPVIAGTPTENDLLQELSAVPQSAVDAANAVVTAPTAQMSSNEKVTPEIPKTEEKFPPVVEPIMPAEQLTTPPMSAPLEAKLPSSPVYSPTDPLLP